MSVAHVQTSSPKRVEALYSNGMLALAASLARYPLDPRHALRAQGHSRTCGSVVDISLDLQNGRITTVGLRVSACAVGQAAAAVFARGAPGGDRDAMVDAHTALASWLAGAGPPPAWPSVSELAPALPFTGRHAAILLPWDAALKAWDIEHTGGREP